MTLEIAKHAFTVSEFNQMAEACILSEDDRVELIDGEVIETSPIGKRHAACVDRFTSLLTKLGDSIIVRVQGPIQLDDYSEPQPDITLLRQRTDFYADSLPRPSDVLLLIEVADTTTEYDRLIKLPAYARAGISEVWIENLPEDSLEMYSEPIGGAYNVVKYASRGEFVQSLTIANLRFAVDDILG